MMSTTVVLWALIASSLAFPNTPTNKANFQSVPHARGVPQGKVLAGKATQKVVSGKVESSVEHVASESGRSQVYGGNFHGSQRGGGGGGFGGAGGGGGFGGAGGVGGGFHGSGQGPVQTIYVNVPNEEYQVPPPIQAGPARKHFRIVFIKSPAPPPPQIYYPPKVEQKTLIYVLHPKQNQTQSIVEVPEVKHDPQVYFIHYDHEPPTHEELQYLVKNTIDGQIAQGQDPNLGAAYAGAPSPPSVFPPSQSQPTYGQGFPQSNNIYKRSQPQADANVIQTPPASQSFQGNSPQIIRAKPEPRESVKLSQGFQNFQGFQQTAPANKFVQTRSTGGGSKAPKPQTPKVRQAQQSQGSANFAGKQAGQPVPASKKFTRSALEPSDSLRAAFGEEFNRPFRFGSKIIDKKVGESNKRTGEARPSTKTS